MKKKAVVVGAGIAGLSCGVRLLSKGYDVIIYEKNASVGGKVNQFQQNGFTFDLTASILMMPEPYYDVFRCAGKNLCDYVNFNVLDPLYRVFYPDGQSIDFSSDMKLLSNTIDSLDSGSTAGFFGFLAEGFRKYTLANKYFLNKSFIYPWDFFNPKILYQSTRLHTLSNTYSFISKYVNDERLRQFLSFQAMYVGSSPFDLPNIYSLIPSCTFAYGLYHIKGGMYSYVSALEKLIRELGGQIRKCCEIQEIVFKDNTAIGVMEPNSFQPSDAVICCCDYPYTLKNLISDNTAAFDKVPRINMKKMNLSCSTFMLYLGIDTKLPALNVHNICISKNYKENISAAFKGYLPQQPNLYVYCPTRIDSSMAPEGCECINAMLRVPNLIDSKFVWNEETVACLENMIIGTLCRIKGLYHLKDHVVCRSYSTPEMFLTKYNSYGGAAFGLSHNLLQTTYYRPQAKLPGINGLYFSGASVHPGAGISIVLNSSKLAVEALIKDFSH